MSNTHPNVLLAHELASELRCGKSTIYMLARTGRIPVYAIGDTGMRFDREAVLTALQQPRRGRQPRKGKPQTKHA